MYFSTADNADSNVETIFDGTLCTVVDVVVISLVEKLCTYTSRICASTSYTYVDVDVNIGGDDNSCTACTA